jgi:dihydropteroate synthase
MSRTRDYTSIIGALPQITDGTDAERLLDAALALVADGADSVCLDATNPWAATPAGLSFVGHLAARLATEGVAVGIETSVADIAVVTLDKGARWIHDPSGARADPFMPRIVQAARVEIIIAQSGSGGDPHPSDNPDDYLIRADQDAERLRGLGVPRESVIIDAGLGPLGRHGDWRLLDHMARLQLLGHPVFVDASYRQLVSGHYTPGSETMPPEEELDTAAFALAVLAASGGAWGIRVQNVQRIVTVIHGLTTSPRTENPETNTPKDTLQCAEQAAFGGARPLS